MPWGGAWSTCLELLGAEELEVRAWRDGRAQGFPLSLKVPKL